MILTSPQAQAVAAGRKTTHRLLTGYRRFRVGQRIPISDTDGPVCRVEIVSVAHDELRDLTRSEAQAEGYGGARGPLSFKRQWIQRDRAFVTKHEATDTGLTDELVSARFNERHAGTPLVMLAWRLTEPPERYLAPVSGTTQDPKRSIDPDASVIDPDPHYVKHAAELAEQQRASFRRDLEAERARQKAESPRTIARATRGRSRRAA